MSRYLLSGYYGFGNAGDEAILLAIINDLRRQDAAAKITVLSANPDWTAKQHAVRAIPRMSFWQVAAAMRSTDLLISGGGGLLQDSTSKRSPLYYLGLIRLATWLGKPAMVYANSLGPLRQPLNRRLTGRILNRAAFITVRDAGSRDFLSELGITKPAIEETADPVLLLDGPIPPTTERLVTFAIREWPSEHDFMAEVVAAGNRLVAAGFGVRFVPLHYSRDLELAKRLTAAVPGSSCLGQQLGVAELLQAIAASDVVVGMRLHALIMAAICRRPMVGIGYDPKVTGFLTAVQQPLAGMTEDLQADRLVELVQSVWTQRSEISAGLHIHVQRLRHLAARNTEIAVALAKGVRP